MKNTTKAVLCCFGLLLGCNIWAEEVPAITSSLEAQPTQDRAQAITEIRVFSQSGHYAASEEQLRNYRTQYGEDKAYQIEQARLWALTNQSTKALAALAPLLQADPKDQVLLDIQSYAIAHPEPKTLATKTKDDKAILIQSIQTALLKGNYDLGAKKIKDHENTYGKDPAFLTEKARYFALTNQSKAALQILEPLLQQDPNNQELLQIKQYAIAHPSPAKTIALIPETPMDAAKRLARSAEQANDPILYSQAAKAYLVAQDNADALLMINKAVALKPNDVDYLYSQAEMANQAGDYKTAYAAYRKVYAQNKNSGPILLGYARSASSCNKLDHAAKLYTLYIRQYPNDSKALLEAAYVENFRGNFRQAISLLDQYRARFGESKDYLIERARVTASATRPTQARGIVNQLLPLDPDNYDLNYANTTALYYLNQPIEMFDSLSKVDVLDPDSAQTQGLNSFIHTPYRSNAGMDVYHSRDSDTVDITKAVLSSQYFISPLTSLIGNVGTEELSASSSSGLNPIDGGKSLNLSTANLGLTQQVTPNLGLSGLVGGANVSDGQNAFIYQANAFIRWNDYFKTNLLSKESYYDVSPKAVSLGVKQNITQANFLIEPCLQCYLNVNTSYSTFSDDNSMEFASAKLMRTFLATQLFNLNFGVTAQWDGFAKQLNDGYYNPESYQYYAGIIDLYIKQSDNVGYSLIVGLGEQKDETFTKFTSANDYGGRAYFGIYNDWYLVLSGGYSTRLRSVAENPTLGEYHVYGLDAALTKRFN